MTNPANIFIVEDESIVSLEIQGRLEELGYAVAGAAYSGEDALEILKSKRPDLILMDINLRGDIDGIETANEIKKLYDIPIIYMTAYADEETIQRAKVSEPYAYIIKPIEVRELHTSIEITLFKSQMEDKLKSSERRFRNLFENASIGLYQTTPSGEIIVANNALIKMLGFESLTDLRERNGSISGYVEKNRRSEFIALIEKNGSIIGFESQWRKKDGSIIFISESARKDVDVYGNEIIEGTVEDITLKELASVELKKSEEVLSVVFDSVYNGILIHDIDGNIYRVNKRFADHHGLPVDQIQGGNVSDIVKNPDTLALIKSVWPEILKGKTKLLEIQAPTHTSQNLHDLEIFLSKISIRNKEYVLANIRNVTEQKKAKEAIVSAKETLQKIYDNVYNAIFIHDEIGNVIDVNEKVLSLYQMDRIQALTHKIEEISASDNDFDLLPVYWENVLRGENQLFEWKAMRPNDKHVFDVEVFLSRINLNNREYILANVRDITDQRAAQKKLLTSQMAVEMSGAPIYWLGRRGEINYVNQAALTMLGYSFEEITKMKVADIDPNWDQDYWDNVGYPRLVKKRVDNFETEHVSKSGITIPIEVSSSIIEDNGDETVVAIVTDLTERKTVADNLIAAKEAAEKSDRLKSEFLASMSHEIRTPVNTILSYSSLLKEELREMGIKHFGDIFHSISFGGKRLIRTVDSILNMSQIQTDTFDVFVENINLEEDLLLPLYLEFKVEAENKGLEFMFEKEAIPHFVRGDSYSLGQLFTNLIDNAIKYTNAGHVKISSYSNDDGSFGVNVSDTGIGIAEDFIENLFNPFTQESQGYTRRFDGNGLGLALVKKYCDLNNAEIYVESEKGKGTTFKVLFKNN